MYKTGQPTIHALCNLPAMPDEQTTHSGAYSVWFGRPVALRVAAGEVQTILHCIVIGESAAAVRIRIADVWDLDIFKDMVLAVEALPSKFASFPGH
jgi:hypothetical protein